MISQSLCQEATEVRETVTNKRMTHQKGTVSTHFQLLVPMGCSWPNIASTSFLIFFNKGWNSKFKTVFYPFSDTLY